jgi:hypothetical protein
VQRSIETEGLALLGTLARAEDMYYSAHGEYYTMPNPVSNNYSTYDENLGVDCSGNKYFTKFRCGISDGKVFLIVKCFTGNPQFAFRMEIGNRDEIYVTYDNFLTWQRYKYSH